MAKISETEAYRRRSGILRLPYFVLIVSLLVTTGATYFFYENSRSKDKARFQTEVNKTKSIIEGKIATYITMLKSGRGFIESSGQINTKDFAVFVRNLELEGNYTGIQGIGYAERVVPAQREQITKQMRADGDPDFKIFPEMAGKESEEAVVIIYLEPQNEKNERALGFDMNSDPIRLAAMNAARDSGQVAASHKITLVQEAESARQAGFLIYLPVYESGNIPQTLEDRRRLLKGYVYSPFRATDFLNDVQKALSSKYLSVAIYDSEQSEGDILASSEENNKNCLFATTNTIKVANQDWVVEYTSLRDFEEQSSGNLTYLVLLSGLTVSLLLFGMTYLESSARLNLEKIADNLRKSESEKASLLESEQKARETAEEANHTKDEFIANISHELRTPLNSIAGWSRILQAENVSPDTKEKALQTIDKNLRLQTRIIEDLLDFSKIEASKKDLENKKVVFSEVFEEVIGEISSLASDKGITLEKTNSLDYQRVKADYSKLKKVIKNVLSNAVKFTPSGGEITAEATAHKDVIELKVKDTGAGIKADFLPCIFDNFKQEDSSITRQYGGLGIGLSLSKQIIEVYGGEIKVESEGENKGTEIVIKLPYIS